MGNAIELPKAFTCSKCEKEHRFSFYVYAHWNGRLTHTCDCGQKHLIQSGKATPVQEPRP